MAISVYNTITRAKEPFKTLVEGKVSMYACGVTTYDVCHIGHGMQALIYDVIRAYLQFRGYDVTYVRNYTDVDDKIIARAAELGVSALEHSENMIRISEDDLALMGITPADERPRVSDHIPEIIALIQDIIARGHAYEADGDVYFRVRSFPEYGRLSNRNVEEMLSGARIEVSGSKQDALDFTLWKAAKPGEVNWPSPWGAGRPGWHIECSALAVKFLGVSFDIHGGGKDLIFPHHENEIAQSLCGTHGVFANYWIHNGLVTVDGRKMSKSFNNFLSIKDAVANYHPEAIRYAILRNHYSANIDFSEQAFYDAYSRIIYFYTTLAKIDGLRGSFPDGQDVVPVGVQPPDVVGAFTEAMDDDFNTACALREIGSAFKWLNDLMAAKKPKMKQKAAVLIRVADDIKHCAQVLRLLVMDPEQALEQIKQYLIGKRGIDESQVSDLIAQRDQARLTKDWAEADRIRDQLNGMGIQIMDTPSGSQWQVLP